MPFLGSIIPSSSIGLAATRRAQDRERADKKDTSARTTSTGEARPDDIADITAAAETQPIDGVSKAHENGSEEGREERVSSGSSYGPTGNAQQDRVGPSLDLEG